MSAYPLCHSAVFGDEMWPAAEYGRTMYAVRQRAGLLVMHMEKRFGEYICIYSMVYVMNYSIHVVIETSGLGGGLRAGA